MSNRRDDDFRIRPSAPKNRGQGFVSKVLKQAGSVRGKTPAHGKAARSAARMRSHCTRDDTRNTTGSTRLIAR